MSFTRAQIISTARQWLYTAYLHQGRVKGVAVDCAGLIIGVARELGASNFDTTAYGRLPSGDRLRQMLHDQAILTEGKWQPGQIALLRFDAEPAHLGILGDYLGSRDGLSLIHAYSNVGYVTEHRLADVWRARVVERFEFPGLDGLKSV